MLMRLFNLQIHKLWIQPQIITRIIHMFYPRCNQTYIAACTWIDTIDQKEVGREDSVPLRPPLLNRRMNLFPSYILYI